MGENIKVAVRVRPFNEREKSCSSKLIIQMNGPQTSITDPASGQEKKFAFDYSYWSHDGYKESSDGYFTATSPKYADQGVVFNDLGKGVLDNAWKGYNCSLFAYGQTGSGKSYSMIGYKVNKGIVPIACEELFKVIDQKTPNMKKGEEFQVSLNMIEIYNEQVRDLLVSKTVKGGLKVRQHPTKGFYVEQLSTAPVNSYAAIEAKINEGSHNRTVAATNMNATSSRAHTIVAIHFTQKTIDGSGQNMTKSSVMNLVDLAGSERAESTGATGDRLKEGSAINQSLSTLGNCIKALADQSSGNSKVVVPFRDSVLTKLLQNALGGNSKTIMIAALSPADINYDETLSTLRFADRAKAIKTKAVINESPTDKLIRELREENLKLKAMLEGGTFPSGGGSGGDDDEDANLRMEELMRKNQDEMEAMEKQWQEKLKAAQEEAALKKKDNDAEQARKKSVPHFSNLNEDPALSGLICQFSEPGKKSIGRENADIILRGLSILPSHAVLQNDNGKVKLCPSNNAKVSVNGKPIKQETVLNHNDRVLFGSNHLYLFCMPGVKDTTPAPTYEDAQAEIAENSGVMGLLGDKATSGSKEDILLMDDLVTLYPLVNEANAMSEELDRKVKFELVLMSPQGRGLKEDEGRTEVFVSLVNMDNGNEFFWDKQKFSNRKYLMREMYQNYMEGEKWEVPKEKDPFWEPSETPVMIGTAHVYLQSLSYMIEVMENFKVTDFRGEDQGTLEMELRPCDAAWKELEDEYTEPNELLGQAINFKIKIKCGHDLSPRYESYFCRFKFYLDDKFETSAEAKKSINPVFNFEKKMTFKPVTQQLMNYLQNSYIIVELWGRQHNVTGKAKGTTKELMAKEKAKSVQTKKASPAAGHNNSQAQGGDAAALRGELEGLRKRNERAEAKIKQLQALINDEQKKGSDSVKIQAIDKILSATANLSIKQAAMVTSITQSVSPEKMAKRQEAMGKNTSSACSIQ